MYLQKGYGLFCAVTDREIGCEMRQYFHCSAPTLEAAKMIFESWSHSFEVRRRLGNFNILRVFLVSEREMLRRNLELIEIKILEETREKLLTGKRLLTGSFPKNPNRSIERSNKKLWRIN